MSWGPLIHGHAPKGLLKALAAAAARGTSFGAPTELETRLAQRVATLMPSMERVRFVSSGTEAAMSADARRARGDQARQDRQVRRLLSRPRGLVPRAGGIRRDDARRADEPRRPGGGGRRHAARALQRSGLGRAASSTQHRGQIAAIIVEPIAGNMGRGPAARRIPRTGCATICDRDGDPARLRRSDLRLPRGGRRRAAGVRRPPGPDLPRQDHRRRPAGRRVRRTRRPHGAGRAGGPGLSGRHAVGQPARDDGRPLVARPSCRRGSIATWRSSARSSRPGSRTRRAPRACRCRSTRSARC